MQDRTRAIVEAAEKLAKAIELRLVRDANGVAFAVQHYTVSDSKVRDPAGAALRELADALAIPAAQWTRTPPSEPGVYHARLPSGAIELVGVFISAPGMRADARERSVTRLWLHPWDGDLDHGPAKLSLDEFDAEWWPVPIEPPTAP